MPGRRSRVVLQSCREPSYSVMCSLRVLNNFDVEEGDAVEKSLITNPDVKEGASAVGHLKMKRRMRQRGLAVSISSSLVN